MASLTFKIDAARNLLIQDSARADALLASVRQQAQEAIIDIRRLVYNLRPPALDELGLLSALRDRRYITNTRDLRWNLTPRLCSRPYQQP